MTQIDNRIETFRANVLKHGEETAVSIIDVINNLLISAEQENRVTEEELKEKTFKRLSQYFDIHTEVCSIEKGESNYPKYRIDAILQHKVEKWLIVGIEFKGNEKKKGKNIFDWLTQVRNYSYSTWKGFESHRNIPVFACPPLSNNYMITRRSLIKHGLNHEHNNINTFLAKEYRCGEVRSKTHEGRDQNTYKRIFFSWKGITFWTENFGLNGDWYVKDNYIKVWRELNKATNE